MSLSGRANKTPFTVTGGTGAYDGARGSALVTDVNSTTTGAEVYVPFGGIKESGWGPHEQGRAAIEFYSDIATIYLDA